MASIITGLFRSQSQSKKISEDLENAGFILNYKFEETPDKQGLIRIALKYNAETKESAISNLKRVSSPGLRQYKQASNLPKVLNGLGVAILSTSKGVITDKEAKAMNVGGEVLCYVH